jgi:IS5 family transposase
MQSGFFDIDDRLELISASDDVDPLERLNKVIDFEIFRHKLDNFFKEKDKDRKSNAGRKRIDSIVMFKILILQTMYNLSDANTEYQIKDRLSFMRFLGLSIVDNVPDRNSIWLYKDSIIKAGLIDELFKDFNIALMAHGLRLNSGQMIDASIVNVPIQRNTREQNAKIKQGSAPEEFTAKQLAHKDLDADWVSKNGEDNYGYKNSVNVDRGTKLITQSIVTPCSAHDSQMIAAIIQPAEIGGKNVYADSAYVGENIKNLVIANGCNSKIHEKAYKNNPLSKEQKKHNNHKSKTRCRVEHVFGFMTNSMNGMFIRSIGLVKAKGNIGLMNLAYNLRRVECLIRNNFAPFSRVSPLKN